MNKNKVVWIVAGLSALVLAVVGFWLVFGNKAPQPAAAPAEVQIKITDDGFIPAETTIKPGTRVVWTNNTTAPQRVAAGPYPDRTELPDLDSQTIAPGESYVYTFTETGKVNYANYTKPTVVGVVEVKE